METVGPARAASPALPAPPATLVVRSGRVSLTLTPSADGRAWTLLDPRAAHDACFALFGDDSEERRAELREWLRTQAGPSAGERDVRVPAGPPYLYLPHDFRVQPLTPFFLAEERPSPALVQLPQRPKRPKP